MKPHDKDILKSELSALQQVYEQIEQLINAARDQAGAPAAAIQTMSAALVIQKDITQKMLKFMGSVIDKI